MLPVTTAAIDWLSTQIREHSRLSRLAIDDRADAEDAAQVASAVRMLVGRMLDAHRG